MLFADLVATSLTVARTPARRAKIAALATFLERLSPEECEIGVHFLSGELRQGRIGVGPARVAELRHGRAGDEATLSLRDVDAALDRVAKTSGAGSTVERARLMADLMARSTPAEQDFLQRLLIGEIRQGALEGVMLDALAKAWHAPVGQVRRAVMLSGNAGKVAGALRLGGVASLDAFRLELFRPLQPMLAQPADDISGALSALSQAAAEYKLDGARVQVHRLGSDVRIYTRQLNDVTTRVPEIVDAVLALPVRSIVLDGEVAARRADGRPEPFQVTMRRFGRRTDIDRLRQELPLYPEFFDCLHLDGEDLLDRGTGERLAACAPVVPASVQIRRSIVSSAEQAEPLFQAALAAGYEGLMLKDLTAGYDAGRRGANWLKVKRAHTLDLVVLAAEWGSGRRKGRLSNLHLGARDPGGGPPIMLGKTFKGLTDELLAWQTERFLGLETGRDAYTVYVRPEVVVEIAFDTVQESPRYPAGLALRFARVKRYRPDKSASSADTIDAVRGLFDGQREPNE